jgi:diphosphomevalonate decarboxylase
MSQLFEAIAPSNIAFLKYWGKRDASAQWPANNSLSMTLSACATKTTARRATQDSFSMLGGSPAATTKALRHLETLRRELRLDGYVAVESSNSFPSDAGIASSASGFAALTLAVTACLTESQSLPELFEKVEPQTLARLSRLGSGSACRSIFGGYVLWEAGNKPGEQTVKPLTGPLNAPWRLADSIVVVDSGHKAVSSRDAHQAAWQSPLFAIRLAGIAERQQAMQKALASRDIQMLGSLIEAEATELHAVALTGTPSAAYLKPQTEAVITWLRQARQESGLKAYFTLDAGPNVHIICEPEVVPELLTGLKRVFPQFAVIADEVGAGPTVNCRTLK